MSINKRYDSSGHRYARFLSHEIEMNEIHTDIDRFILVKYSITEENTWTSLASTFVARPYQILV